ncbi:MAG: 1,4-dihydroxy-2-naphthoate polyprenyltransferase [Chloroflexota bacterium]
MTEPTQTQIWITASRPRTLPLAVSSIILGAFLAGGAGSFRWLITLLCGLTAVFLQVLSNLANDYGDSVHGADSTDRSGPSRAVQSGLVAPETMRRAMLLFAGLSLVTGLSLILLALSAQAILWLIVFVVLGAGAVWAAINYTAGSNPYGYAGLGDIFVLIFFGWVGVMGTYFLNTQQLNWLIMLPATACGLLAVAVLNINNIRDIESDKKAGKISIPVRIGGQRARQYHWTLLSVAMLCATLYVLITNTSPFQWLFLLTLPLIIRNGRSVATTFDPPDINPLLKQMSLTTLAFVILFGLGQIL